MSEELRSVLGWRSLPGKCYKNEMPLVHLEKDAIAAYLTQIAKLKPDGVGIIHHSNLGAYPRRLKILEYQRWLPAAVRRIITVGKVEYLLGLHTAWWATSMTGALFEKYSSRPG